MRCIVAACLACVVWAVLSAVASAGFEEGESPLPAPEATTERETGEPQGPELVTLATNDIPVGPSPGASEAGGGGAEFSDSGIGISQTRSGSEYTGDPPVCGLWTPGGPIMGLLPDGTIGIVGYNPDVCEWFIVGCGTERVDEARTGERAGGGFGAYAEWLPYAYGMAAPDFGLLGNGPPAPSPGDLGESTIATVQGTSFGEWDTINFHYCRRSDTMSLITTGTGSPSYSIGSSLPDNFSIGPSRNSIRDALEQRVRLHLPNMAAIPPLDRGLVYVQFPMRFWLRNLKRVEGTFGESDLSTIRITMRATFTHVDWDFGPHNWSCADSDMRPFTGGDPTINIPVCNKTFVKLESHELRATSHYFVEERIQYRLSASDPWPNTPWSPHANSTIEVPNTVGEIEIGEILALTVPID